jgi:hypothetical protein
MSKRPTSTRLSDLTTKQLSDLAGMTGLNQTEVISVAIDRMYREETKMSDKLDYRVIEDNGGGLHLFVFDDQDRVIFAHSGYEYNPGQLSQDLDALDTGDDTSDWDGNSDDPQGEWDALGVYEPEHIGVEIVAAGTNGRRKLYPHRMGTAAQIEFDIERN